MRASAAATAPRSCLHCLARETDGRSLEANLALLESNAALSGSVASAFASGR